MLECGSSNFTAWLRDREVQDGAVGARGGVNATQLLATIQQTANVQSRTLQRQRSAQPPAQPFQPTRPT